ncbi:hypothetical protein, partial [Anaerotruncus colihominis]|uniref:hypothetical protein n=2 Tax=Anaerotruncus colihominis TaxID=169435 RepID=UPI00242C9196
MPSTKEATPLFLAELFSNILTPQTNCGYDNIIHMRCQQFSIAFDTAYKKKDFTNSEVFRAGKDLSFQAVTRQVLSAQLSLTSVF